jgi:Uma2 family endonuclease
MVDPARRIATYDDVLAAPEGMTAEILAGELHLSPRPSSDHAYAEGRVMSDLDAEVVRSRSGGPPGGWWILMEPELHLGARDPKSVVAAPDLAGWRRERMPVMPRVAAFTLRPDWVCEILSRGPAAVQRDRVLKPDLYATAGIPHFWILDPHARTLEVFALREGLYVRSQAFAGDVKVRAEPFVTVEFDLTNWWLPGEPEEEG